MYRTTLHLWLTPLNKTYEIAKYRNPKLFFSMKSNYLPICVNHKKRTELRFKILSQSTIQYSSKSERKTSSRKGFIIFSTITLGTFGILTLVKNNPEIRETLEKWIPGTDRTIRVIFQEDNSHVDKIFGFFNSVKDSIFGAAQEAESTKKVSTKKEQLTQGTDLDNIPDLKLNTKSIEEDGQKSSDIIDVKNEPIIQSPSPSKPISLSELDNRCHQIGTSAVNSYNDAFKMIQDYNSYIIKILEENTVYSKSSMWKKLKEATEEKKNAISQCEKDATDAFNSLKNLSKYLDQFSTDSSYTSSKENINKTIAKILEAKKKYDSEKQTIKVSEQFWKKVKIAQENFNEELEILFPNLKIHEKRSSINAEMLDLFILYMYNKVNYLQTELEKLETLGNEKLKSVLMSSGKLENENKLNELIFREVQKERRQLQNEFQKAFLAERKVFEENLVNQLKLQAQINADQMKETLDLKEQEVQRMIQRSLSEQLEKESNKYKSQIAVIVGRLRGLDEALKIRLNKEKGASKAQFLWAACQALAKKLEAESNNLINEPVIKPLKNEITAVSNIALKDDVLIQTTLAAIPKEAVERGVYSEVALRARFLQVEHTAKKLALVPEEGASLPIYFLSYLQNLLIKNNTNMLSKKELADEPIDVNKFDTYEILNRARFWLDRGDFKMALKYMNLLKGASRSVAKEWMNEMKILLETKQAVDILIAYTGAISLLFLSNNEKQKVVN
ncbi:MICOS complex subunit Mic60 isoform X2 [Chelonus insularis]|uniref:MICOS complex subunit Mic60 isoform X2 n=1 Tax=Chelonus insularis TaxID=460826 RepID=UPI0015894ACA|nr:MICOS complex subunit Mic60 isoform X2 [Chelonus insularis]